MESEFANSIIHGITTSEHVLARLDENEPDNWRGLNDDRSADIVLVHDFAGEAHDLFKRIITRIEEKGIQFRSVV